MDGATRPKSIRLIRIVPYVSRPRQINQSIYLTNCAENTCKNKKHLKNVGPIRNSEPPDAALPFTRCR